VRLKRLQEVYIPGYKIYQMNRVVDTVTQMRQPDRIFCV